MKSREIYGKQEIQFKSNAPIKNNSINSLNNSVLSAQVLKSILSGENAEFKILGKIFTAKSLFRLFKDEIIEMAPKTMSEKSLQIQKRTFTHTSKESSGQEGKLQRSSLEGFYKKESVSEVLDSFFKQESNLTQISESKLFKLLDSLFPFFSWKKDVEVFDWNWERDVAKGYFSSSKEMDSFLLQYESEQLGSARFLIQFSKDPLDWNLYGSFDSMEFYEVFMESREDFFHSLQEVHSTPKLFSLEYQSVRNWKENKGWLA
ncbi:MAG: hypothetical protein JJT78_01115 [Leptospira sp.]|nr:hypothetical protein [Leptospira sp.]